MDFTIFLTIIVDLVDLLKTQSMCFGPFHSFLFLFLMLKFLWPVGAPSCDFSVLLALT